MRGGICAALMCAVCALTALPGAAQEGVSIRSYTLAAKPGDAAPFAEIFIESVPPGAEVFLNSVYAGFTPLTVKSLRPGGYRVTLRRERCRELEFFLTPQMGRELRVKAELRLKAGLLRLTGELEGAEIFAGGRRLTSRETELAEGTYDVRVLGFGFEEFRAQAVIEDEGVCELPVRLAPAAFRVENFSVSRPRFNPANPGLAGGTEFSFRVSAPGSGEIVVLSAGEEEVFSLACGPFSSWDGSVFWNGAGPDGEPLADGVYTAVFRARAEGDAGAFFSAPPVQIEIDSSLGFRYRNIWHGAAGLLYAPRLEVLPPGDFQFGSNIAGRAVSPEGAGRRNQTLFQAGGAVGLARGLEASLSASLAAHNTEDGVVHAGGAVGLTYRFFRAGGKLFSFSLAALGRGMAASSPSWSGFSQFPGFAAGAALEARLYSFGLVLAPEIHFSPYAVGEEPSRTDVRLCAWAVGRAGLFYDAGVLSLGVSAAPALRCEGGGAVSPRHMGFEFHFTAPRSFLTLSGFVSWEEPEEGRGALFAGGGLGIAY